MILRLALIDRKMLSGYLGGLLKKWLSGTLYFREKK